MGVHGLAELPAASGMELRLSAREARLDLDLRAAIPGAGLWQRLRARFARRRMRGEADVQAPDARRLSFVLRAEDANVDLDYLQLRDAEWELRLQAMDERRVHATLQTLAPDARLWFAGAIERLR